MTNLKQTIALITAYSALIFIAGGASVQAQTQEASSQSVTDCTNISLEGQGDEELTKAERIKKLEGTLYDSVDQYDTCVGQAIAAGGGGGGGGGGAGGAGQGSGNGSGQNDASNTEQSNEAEEATETSDQESPEQPPTDSTGGVPKDIPSADNDSVLQRQIRELATKEKDPQKQKELWDLYRKYKT